MNNNLLDKFLPSLLDYYRIGELLQNGNNPNFNIDDNHTIIGTSTPAIKACCKVQKFRSKGDTHTYTDYLEVFPELFDVLTVRDNPRETLNYQSIIKKIPYKEKKSCGSRKIDINIQNNNGRAQDVYLIGIGIFSSSTENISDIRKCLVDFISERGLYGFGGVTTIDKINVSNGHANITLNTGGHKYWVYHIIQNDGRIISEPFMLITYKRFLKDIENSYMKRNMMYMMMGSENLFSYCFYSMFNRNNETNEYEIRNEYHFGILFFIKNNDNERIIRNDDASADDEEHSILLNQLVDLSPSMENIINVLKNNDNYQNIKDSVRVLRHQLLIDKSSPMINLIRCFDFCNIDRSLIDFLINQQKIHLNSPVNDLLDLLKELEGNIIEIRNISVNQVGLNEINNIIISLLRDIQNNRKILSNLNQKSNKKLKTIKLKTLYDIILFQYKNN
ncbi:hypothetical protein H8356DRAFT_982690 [Neocallimastix lanati (nom. inval.)]|uniref:Uncharacterized protein n=1 Tax=Neocallimastix californiae TaxID=1754190 RepID=A0A1Y2DBH9_9FUNG|nr:hypothetical protein H8356DRAFT_982690 [Neocallimastix sp. JGI-2020a]ORY56476.1 hypothetical protein LY90DRAFT_645094 [Neocallimastix californiae]|eukprot:ORY56476.1 hypothetical protein LY90DRAFT_645094 [Neocallimastix californiae]